MIATDTGTAYKYLFLGGSGDRRFSDDVITAVVSAAGIPDAINVLIIPTASNVPERVSDKYRNLFQNAGVERIEVLDIRSTTDADAGSALEKLAAADLVMFTGGDQLRLLEILKGTSFIDVLNDRNQNGLVTAGSSAGAMAAGSTAIVRGVPEDFPYRGRIRTEPGFGWLENMLIDTHLSARCRSGRLLQAVTAHPECLGVGIDENTGIAVSTENILTVFGNGLVMIVDGRDAEPDPPGSTGDTDIISINNLKIHLLKQGSMFDLNTRASVNPTP